jgi:hypothetical protein
VGAIDFRGAGDPLAELDPGPRECGIEARRVPSDACWGCRARVKGATGDRQPLAASSQPKAGLQRGLRDAAASALLVRARSGAETRRTGAWPPAGDPRRANQCGDPPSADPKRPRGRPISVPGLPAGGVAIEGVFSEPRGGKKLPRLRRRRRRTPRALRRGATATAARSGGHCGAERRERRRGAAETAARSDGHGGAG